MGTLRWSVLTLCLVALPSWATFQQREQLMLDGKEVELLVLPLTPWLDAHPRALPESSITSTNSWRGYLGYWEVRDGRLWLTKVTQKVPGQPGTAKTITFVKTPGGWVESSEVKSADDAGIPQNRDILSVLFGNPKPVVATWFSGTLVAVLDDATCLERYGSGEPCFLVLWVDKGEVGRRVELDLAQLGQFRCDRFAAYKQTPAYAERLREVSDSAGKDAERWVYDFASPYYLALEGAASSSLDAAACRRLNE
jgi:hypothetical protein